MITAPYNFVPLNDKVFYPSWSEDVSHDIPFEDADSGEIDITITAKSPIFIRDSKDEEKFCNHNNKHYIPSTSLKGVIRTILEIISYSKLKLEDKTLAYRDLNHPSYKKKAMDTNKIYMGWLYKKDNIIHIENIGKLTASETRIKYTQMKQYLDDNIVNKIKKTKEAYKKYNLINNFNDLKTSIGTIVFTGSTGNKTREFLFPNTKPEKIYKFSQKDKLFQTFLSSYYIGTPNESKDWKNLWAKKFKNGNKIPIFFQLDKNQNIKHFGLSMLYKLPYEYSLQEILENYQDFKNILDLSEVMFGYVDGKKALKGRINFSHAFLQNKANYIKKVSLPLSTPRATFYPNYIVHKEINGKTKQFITYDNKDAILRGFKLYPPRKNPIISDEICKKNQNVCTKFIPLDKGAIFSGKIRFFNLKELELGALLSAITFLNTNSYYHKIGMAKAFGYGTVKISINNISTNKDIQYYIEKFKTYINQELNINLTQEPRIQALYKLCSFDITDDELKFMNIKGFVNAKKPFNKFILKNILNNKTKKTITNTNNQQIKSTKSNTISKTKMRKALKENWERVFKIFYHPNQIKEFINGEFKTTPEEQQQVYIKLKNNEKFKALIKNIDLYNNNKLNEQEKIKLYNIIENLK